MSDKSAGMEQVQGFDLKTLEGAVDALKRTRRRLGISASQVAERMGVSSAVVSRLESGTHEPKFTTVQRYAQAIGCSVAIVGREESGRAVI